MQLHIHTGVKNLNHVSSAVVSYNLLLNVGYDSLGAPTPYFFKVNCHAVVFMSL